MPHIGITVHRTKREAWEFASQVITWLQSRPTDGTPIAVSLDRETALKLERLDLLCSEEEWHQLDLVVTLGGDGTILTASRMAAPYSIPILGVHMGRFGFMAATVPADLFACLEKILGGKMDLEERLMVEVEVLRHHHTVYRETGLNEVVIRTSQSNLLNLKTYIGSASFAEFPADGLIISTPTGSTGYSLSAGGPIVAPTVEALVMTALCPHTLSARPLILPCDEELKVKVDADGDEALCLVDNIHPFPLLDGDEILVRKAQFKTRLVVLDDRAFYRKIRQRYRYGERLNQ